MSLRLRIIAVFAICIALPVVAGWASLWLSASQSSRSAAFSSLQADAATAMRTIEERLARNLGHLKAWSTMPMMQEVLINDDGGELAQALADLVRAYPDFESLTATDTRGIIVATTDPTLGKARPFEAGDTRAAISGRTTQETLVDRHHAAIRFTVPLVASYDRQTVIGTLTGMIGLATLYGDMMQGRLADPAAPGYALVTKEKHKTLFATMQAAALAPAINSLDADTKARPIPITISGEPGVAAISGSGARILGKDPGLFIAAFKSRAAMEAPATSLSDIVLGSSILAGVLSLLIAWRWATPLVRLNEQAAIAFKARRTTKAEQTRGPDSFAALADALARLKPALEERDTLAKHAQELALAIAIARDNARHSNERLQQLAGSLTAHMAEITELVELINRENLAAAGRRHDQPRLEELNRAALGLLQVIQDAVDAVQEQPGTQPTVTELLPAQYGRQSA
jgi:methyl-accepting chemotaxis protein